MKKDTPDDDRRILHEAGQQLALLHTVPVDGFGWIDRHVPGRLSGEKRSFPEYYGEYLEHDLDILDLYPFPDNEKNMIRTLLLEGKELLNVKSAVLVHGDFDISHIFHKDGRYAGLIDFGEIRGNNRVFDLATFVGFYQNRDMLTRLLEGYREISHFDEEDFLRTETMALFMLIRHLGKSGDDQNRAG